MTQKKSFCFEIGFVVLRGELLAWKGSWWHLSPNISYVDGTLAAERKKFHAKIELTIYGPYSSAGRALDYLSKVTRSDPTWADSLHLFYSVFATLNL